MSETTPSGLAGSSTAITKKRKIASTRRKESACWGSFEKIELPEERQKALQRNYDGKCLACGTVVTGKPSELNRHLSACKEIGLSDQLVALTHATAKGASSASSSGQQNKLSSPMKKYLDKAAIGPHEMRRLQLLLAQGSPRKRWICFQSTMVMTVQRPRPPLSTTPAFRLVSTLPVQC